jgi:hypothetical protein
LAADSEYHFAILADTIIYQETKPWSDGLGGIIIDWVDSDSALAVIKNNGGRTIITRHPDCSIEASLFRLCTPRFFDTYWRVVFQTLDSTFTFHLINAETGTILSSIVENEEPVARDFVLYQNYPNPFNPTTTISYFIRESDRVIIKIFDLDGNEIKTLCNHQQSSGLHKIQFDGSELGSGIYLCRIGNRQNSYTIKMSLLK